jgi:hypothetical protein
LGAFADASSVPLTGDGQTTDLGTTLSVISPSTTSIVNNVTTYTKVAQVGYSSDDYSTWHSSSHQILCSYVDGHVAFGSAVISADGYDSEWSFATSNMNIVDTSSVCKLYVTPNAHLSNNGWAGAEAASTLQAFSGDCALRFRTNSTWANYAIGLTQATDSNRKTTNDDSSVFFKVQSYGNTDWNIFNGMNGMPMTSAPTYPYGLYSGGDEWTVERKGTNIEFWRLPPNALSTPSAYILEGTCPDATNGAPLMGKVIIQQAAFSGTDPGEANWVEVNYLQVFSSAIL